AERVGEDGGAFEVAAVGAVPAVVHRVEDAHVHRLEAVPDIGQRTADDDRHRVVDVAPLHLDLDVDRLGPVSSTWRCGRVHVRHLLFLPMPGERSLAMAARPDPARPIAAAGPAPGARCRGTSRPWRCAGWTTAVPLRPRP